MNKACNFQQTWYDEQQSLYQLPCTVKINEYYALREGRITTKSSTGKSTYFGTSMKNRSTKIVGSGSKRKCKENCTKLELHGNKTEDSLHGFQHESKSSTNIKKVSIPNGHRFKLDSLPSYYNLKLLAHYFKQNYILYLEHYTKWLCML